LGSGGGVSPIRVSASRIAPADVRSPGRQSTWRNRFKSVGTAVLALGPRFPRDAATQSLTESSLMSSKDTISFKVASSTFLGSMPRVKASRFSALPVRIVEVSPVRILAIVSANGPFATALLVDCAVQHGAQINTAASVESHNSDDPLFTSLVIAVLTATSQQQVKWRYSSGPEADQCQTS
jgi:hypothetical protein